MPGLCLRASRPEYVLALSACSTSPRSPALEKTAMAFGGMRSDRPDNDGSERKRGALCSVAREMPCSARENAAPERIGAATTSKSSCVSKSALRPTGGDENVRGTPRACAAS